MEENASTVFAAMQHRNSTNMMKIRRLAIGSLVSPIDSTDPNIAFLESQLLLSISLSLLVGVKHDL